MLKGLSLLALLLPQAVHAAQLQTYPVPAGVDTSSAFTLRVRSVGSNDWQNVTLFKPRHAEVNFTTGSTAMHFSSLAYFDFDGPVEVSATYNNGQVCSSQVRPQSLQIQPQISQKKEVTFQLSEPVNVFLQVNSNVFDGLHIMTNTIEKDAPSPNDPNVVYFGPGLHAVPGTLNVNSSQTVYLAGGAVVKTGGVAFTNITDASIRGRGVFMSIPGAGTAISVTRSKNISISDFVGLDVMVRGYEANNMFVSNARVFSSVQYGDGLDLFCCNNVVMDKLFMRTADDSLAIYNHRDTWYGDSTNITLKNSALWADVAHPINIGTHGNPINPETIDGVQIQNIDIMDHREGQVLFQGCIALNPGDENLLQNFIIDNVRVENFRLGQLLNLRVMKNSYNTAPGRGIKNVTISNLSYAGSHCLTSILAGYDENRRVEVVFNNLTVNGKVLNASFRKPGWYLYSDFVPMFVNEHTNVTYH